MGRYRFPAFVKATTPRYVVVWDLQWALIECERLKPGADLSEAMAETVDRLACEGWEAEADTAYGFVFIGDGHDRRLLMLTPRDPYKTALQSFSPFRQSRRPE